MTEEPGNAGAGAKNIARSRNGTDKSPDADCLRKVYLEITTDCNMYCGMCIRHSWQQARGVMSQAIYESLIAAIRRMPSVSVLNFGGFGEPLLHPDFFEYAFQAKEAGLSVELVTNGILLNQEAIERLLELEVDRVFVSLDGVGRQKDGTFHEEAAAIVHRNLRALYRAKAQCGAAWPEVVIAFVASRRNIAELPAIRRLARELGASRILVTNLVPYTRELASEVLYGRWTTARRGIPPSPWNPAVDFPRVDPRSEATRIIDDLAVHGSNVSVNGTTISGGAMSCRFVEEGRLAIDSAGSVSPCLPLLHSYDYYFRKEKHSVRAFHLDSVARTPLDEIWESPQYRAFRDRVRKFEFSPCIDCGGCDLRESNEDDCFGSGFPSCGECLWAAGFVQCP